MARTAATSNNDRRRHAHLVLAALVCGVAALALLLRTFPPGQYSFYPRCPIYDWTGLLCPGCGATRALAALAHGNVSEALHWNAPAVISLPVLAVWGSKVYRGAITDQSAEWPRISNRGIAAVLAIATAFVLLRNWG